MKLNKFFALKTNFVTNLDDPDAIASIDVNAGGSNASTAPLPLTMAEIQEQLLHLDDQLLKKFPNISAEEMTAKQVAARRELVALATNNPAVNFSQDDFAEAVGLTPAQAIAQYYGVDLDDLYGADRLKIGGGGLSLTDKVAKQIRTYAEANPDSSTFSTFDFSPPSLVEASDVEVETDFSLPSATDLQTRLDAFIPRDRQMPHVTQDTPAFTVADTLDTSMFDAINFPEPTINRGVPVVTKGIDAQGNPTTGITMGTAAASPSGPTIGELDISTILPSTGMGIMPDGTGTTAVGTQDTTGNIVASSADTLNMLDPGIAANPISEVDTNVLGTQGNQVASTITQVTPPPKDAHARAIQNLFKTSQTKDIAAQRIGDYAASVGGLTAEEIASAVTPILGQQPTFGIDPFESDQAAAQAVLGAAQDFGYGKVGGQPFITQDALVDVAPPDFQDQQARLQFLSTPEAAVGTGDYTDLEKAMRGLDYAKRQGMSLEDAGAAFGMSADDVRAQADTLGIDLGALGFAHGGEVEETRDAAVGSRLMAHAGIGSMQGKSMSPEMAGTIDRIMARRR